jgi:hypothetical protein
MNIPQGFRGVEKTITMVLAAGVIAESIAIAGATGKPFVPRSNEDLFRVAEDSVELTYDAGTSTGYSFFDNVQYQEGKLFLIDTAEDLRLAFAQQSEELIGTFYLNIKVGLDVKEVVRKMDSGLTRCTWRFQYTVDARGNRVDTEHSLHMFTVEYRDDFRVLQAFYNDALVEKLTAGELALMDKAEQIIGDLITPDMGDYEIVLAIHNYLILNGQYADKSDDPILQAALHKTEGILMNGAGVCSSYAGSMYLLLNMLDVKCLFVTGVGRNSSGLTELHAWNKVLIYGDWYNFDVTWDDPVPDKPGGIRYAHFGLTDEAFSVNHTWDREVFPQSATSTTYNYYIYNDLKSKDYKQFKEIVSRQLLEQKSNPEIVVHLYVENYDQSKYPMSFIYDILPKIKTASCTKINGTSGEFILRITQEGK